MKTTFLFALLVLMSLPITAQGIMGAAVYKSKVKPSVELDSTLINPGQMELMKQQLSKLFEDDYTLKFSATESLYTENPSLEENKISTPKMSVTVLSDNSILYKNTANEEMRRQRELFGKIFLIKDSLEKPDWKLEKETKMIGKYRCHKATWTREVTEREYNDGELSESTEERTATAWYAPEIPVNTGPGNYWGLPGLILEIHEEDLNLLCTEITLNPKEEFSIEAPEKGTVVSVEEFEKIQEEKTQEMRARGGRGGHNRGSGFTRMSNGRN